MAHQIENMFSAGGIVPWHGLGKVVEGVANSAEAIKLAGLDWNVDERNIWYMKDDGSMSKVPKRKALIRSTDERFLGDVSEDFTPFQNDKAFAFFDPFIESGLASYETAGSLKNGQLVWVLAKLNKAPIEVGSGDEVTKYLLLANAHNATMSVRAGFTPTRVVCANTLAMAMDSDASKLMRVHHKKNVDTDVEKVREIINAADAKFEATAEQYRYLTKSNVNKTKLEEYVQIVFRKATMSKEEERRAAFVERMNDTITQLFETGTGSELASASGTMWGLYNAVSGYLTHIQGRTQESRLNSNWFGQNKIVNDLAFRTAMEMA